MLKNKIVKTSFIYGGLTALVCVIVALIQFYFLEKSPFGRYKMPAFGINIIFIFGAIWQYRQQNNGLLSFTEGFSVGFLTNLIGAFLTAICFFIFIEFIDNQMIMLWVKENIEQIMKLKDAHIKNFGELDFKNLLEQAKKIPTSTDVFIDEIVKKQTCVIAVTIISMILRKHFQ